MIELRCVLDFETRSRANLKHTSATEYAKDESTSIFCVGYKVNHKPSRLWIPERGPMPPDLWECFQRGVLVAHTASFERAVTRYTLTRYSCLTLEQKECLHTLPPSRWRCTAAKAAACSLPRSLEGSGQALGLATQKDMKGSRLIKKYMKPRKPSKHNPHPWWSDKSELRGIYRYCLVDVEAEYELDQELPDLSPYEQKVWELDQRINDRGVLIDIPTVKIILGMIREEMGNLTKAVRELSGGSIDSVGQNAKLLKWVNARGAALPNLQAATIRDRIIDPDLDEKVRTMLEYRQSGSKTSTAKYHSMVRAVGDDHRARELLLYAGAMPTMRWAGKRIQPQNFPRPTIPDFNSDEAIELIQSGGLKAIRKKYGKTKVMDVLVSAIRGMLIASSGYELFCADFAAIELCLTFWVAEHEEGLRAIREGRKMYEEMAAAAFDMDLAWLLTDEGKKSLERFVGKESVLGCFEADTPVLTRRGWVRIVDVSQSDELWDGVEWVRHSGVIFQGLRDTIRLAGIGVTPEHQVLTQDGWATASQVAQENTPHLKSAISLARAMSPATFGSSRTERTLEISAPLPSPKKPSRVYDVTNAGPRNRFTILTDAGPLIVHNCGYGMGWAKFLSQCHKKGMKKVTPEIAKKAVYTYRQIHAPVPALWRNLEIATIQAIQNPGKKYFTNKVTIYVSGNFLCIKLPSGRRLRYFKPRLSQKQLASGKLVPQIHHWAVDHHQWCEVVTWGGVLANNVVQGIARDLMVSGIFNIEEAGYRFLLSVHDEGLGEKKKGCGNLKEYISLMTKIPDWAKGAPVRAEGWGHAKRYHK